MKIFSKKLFFLIYILFLFCIITTGCHNISPTEPISKFSVQLNTIITITIYDSTDEKLLDECFSICDKYEDLFSRTKENSELYKLNHGELPIDSNGFVSLTEETADLIRKGLYYSEISQGLFDLSIAPLTSLWDFSNSSPTVPSLQEIEETLLLVNYKELKLVNNQLKFLKPNRSIDLGAIAKGYIADKIKDYLMSQGVKSAIINLGGNVLCIGNKLDGYPFKIGIQKPFANRNETIATMNIKDKSVVSSGIYERFFEENGTLYHHLLNPKTGFPYENNLISVTIVSDKSVDGDALSTTCFSLGLEKGLSLAEQTKGVDAIFVTSNYEIHYTKNFKDLYGVQEVK